MKPTCAHCGKLISREIGFASIRIIETTGIRFTPLCNPPGDQIASCYFNVVVGGHDLGLPKTNDVAKLLQDDDLDRSLTDLLERIHDPARTPGPDAS